MVSPDSRAYRARRQAETPLSVLCRFPEPALYASTDYRQRLAGHDITVSMSRPGNPYDNAKAESFMKTLKTEEINGKGFTDISDARRRINSFITEVYNKYRLHSALGYQSPLEFETAFAQNKAR
jgi:putative transposase